MGIVSTLSDAWTDFRKLGVNFALGGLRERIGKGEVILRTHDKNIIVRRRNSDLACVRQALRDEQYQIKVPEFQEYLNFRYNEILVAGHTPVIVDAGANIGSASIWFAALYPKAAIVAIEPDKANANLLRRNVSTLPGAIVLEVAVGGSGGHVSTQWAEGAGWAIQTSRADAGVEVVTIEQAVHYIPNSRLFIAKVDIEGFEDDLFSKNTDWMDVADAIFIEPHEWMFPGRSTSRNFQREFGKRSFKLLINGENLIYIRDYLKDGS